MSEITQNTKTMGTLSIVFGILSILVFAFLFGPAAITLGTIAGSKGDSRGWWGLGLGSFGLIAWVFILMAAAAA